MILPDPYATGVEVVCATLVEVLATRSEMVRKCTCKLCNLTVNQNTQRRNNGIAFLITYGGRRCRCYHG